MTGRRILQIAALAVAAGTLVSVAVALIPGSTLKPTHPVAAAQVTPQPLYYQDPSGSPLYSSAPRVDGQGRSYVAIYDDKAALPTPVVKPAVAAVEASASSGRNKILYYRNPMGLPDTSPIPKKDSMGMDYIPVYADEVADQSGTVKISADKIQTLGVRTEVVSQRAMRRSIRAVGRITFNERNVGVVSPRFEGWITKLYVNTTGAAVRRGDPLFEIYSPDLALAEQEYLIAQQSSDAMAQGDMTMRANAKEISTAALARLRNWGISADQITRLQRTESVDHALVLRAPMNGVVLEKTALQGMRFAPGDTLYRIADLSSVWVIADVFEQDLALVHPGDPANVTFTAYPDKIFTGKIAFIYPTMDQATRTTKVRIELSNPDLLLKENMYATVEIAAPVDAAKVLALPVSAVLDNGTRQVVLVDRGGGRFEPRPVKLGTRANDYVEVIDGVTQGENVVVEANFLIDAESNLRAALQSFTAPAQEAKQP